MPNANDYPPITPVYICGNNRCDYTSDRPGTCPWDYGRLVVYRHAPTVRRQNFHSHMLDLLKDKPSHLAAYLKKREQDKPDKCPKCADGRMDVSGGLGPGHNENGWLCDVCGHERIDIASLKMTKGY